MLVSSAKAPDYGTVLRGKDILIRAVRPQDANDLFQATTGPDTAEKLFRFLFDDPYDSVDAFRSALEDKARTTNPWTYSLALKDDSQVVGMASLMRMDQANAVIEVGYILYTPALQKTRAATEAMYLFAKHVFEDLRFRRYEWKCNSENTPSRVAAARLGFTFEGLFRQHMIVKGRNRDTAWFSMLDSEWPARKAALEAWLDDSNFDEHGRQKKRLEEFRMQPTRS